jgi:hypothetical protein
MLLLWAERVPAQEEVIRSDLLSASGVPVWQPAVDVFDSDGNLVADVVPEALRTHRWEPFNEYADRARAGALRAEEGHCFSMTVPLSDYGVQVHDPGTLTELVEHAQAIVQGTVAAVTGGFLLGHPGLMLRLEDTRWVRPYGEAEAYGELLVFYPVGEFDLGSARFCSRGSKFPDPPKPGAEVLLFMQGEPIAQGANLVRLAGTGAEIVFSDELGLHAPYALHDVPALLKQTTITELRRKAAKIARVTEQ